MKRNLKLFVAILAFIPAFISCSDDNDDPSVGGATIVFDESEITITDGKLPKAITGSITAPTGTEIQTIKVTANYEQDGQKGSTEIKDGVTEVSGSKKGKYTFRFDDETSGIKDHITELQSIEIEVQVKNGDQTSRSLKINQEVTPDPEPWDMYKFEWKRVGGADGTGLEEYGLTWTSNTATAAIIKTDSKTKMVKLTADDWTKIETKEQLKEAVDKGTDIAQYDGISATASKTYDEVLAVNVKGEGVYYLIHITKGTVDANASGTTITISGESRK